jgi:ankyrin repeat protein
MNCDQRRRRRRRTCRELSLNVLSRIVVLLVVLAVVVVVDGSALPATVDKQDMLVNAVHANDPIAIERAVMRMGADINRHGKGGQTPVLTAVLMGHVQAVETLINLGADLSLKEHMGYSVIHAAAFQGRAQVLKLLADHGIELMEHHDDGYYAMHRACWGTESRHTDTVHVFLEAGVPPNLKAGNGMTCSQMTKNVETKKLVEAATIAVAGVDDATNDEL